MNCQENSSHKFSRSSHEKMSLNVMNFMQQMDEIYFIIGVKKYTNGIDFHDFHGGKFLPCQIFSESNKNTGLWDLLPLCLLRLIGLFYFDLEVIH